MKAVIVSLVTTLACLTSGRAATESDSATALEEPAIQKVRQQAEEQGLQAQAQMKEVSKAWKDAAKAMRSAQAAMAEVGEEFEDHFEGFPGALSDVKNKIFTTLAAPARAATKPLIIPSGDLNPDTRADLEEDCAVMARILNKAAGERGGHEEHDWAMGIALSSLGGGRRPQSIYLEGYGALFLVNASFPLVPPPNKEIAANKEEESSDSEWEDTKEELFGDGKTRRRGPVTQPFPGGAGPKMEYESERVGELKKNVLEALKNAGNIRRLKPDEFITVAITGPGHGGATRVQRLYRNDGRGTGLKGSRTERDVIAVVKTDRESTRDETHLIVRVKKGDADEFAKGKLTLQEFENKAQVVAY